MKSCSDKRLMNTTVNKSVRTEKSIIIFKRSKIAPRPPKRVRHANWRLSKSRKIAEEQGCKVWETQEWQLRAETLKQAVLDFKYKT